MIAVNCCDRMSYANLMCSTALLAESVTCEARSDHELMSCLPQLLGRVYFDLFRRPGKQDGPACYLLRCVLRAIV